MNKIKCVCGSENVSLENGMYFCNDCHRYWKPEPQKIQKILIDEINPRGGLNRAYQNCKIFAVKSQGELPIKVGFELRIVENGNIPKNYKPRSMFFNQNEITILDRFIKALNRAKEILAQNAV